MKGVDIYMENIRSPKEEFFRLVPLLPDNVILDITKRMSDWLNSGGDEYADYMHQQVRYANNVLRLNTK